MVSRCGNHPNQEANTNNVLKRLAPSIQSNRTSAHARTTYLATSFLGLLDPSRARKLAVFLEVGAGRNGAFGSSSGSLRALLGAARRVVGHVHDHQQLRVHGVAGAAVQRGVGAAVHHGVRARAGRVAGRGGASGLVGPHVGAHALRRGGRRRHGARAVRVRHGRLRVRRRAVQWRRGGAAGHAGGVHARRQRRARLLRRQPRRRLQPAHARHAGQQQRRQLRLGQVRGDGVRGGAERRVPGGPAGGGGGGPGGGVPERVRGVRGGAVLLQRRVREPEHVPAVGLLGVLQERVPARLQLRLRRLHLHLHLRRRLHRLRHHLLPRRANQRQVVGTEPAGRRAAAADERHHGLLRRRRHQRTAQHRRRLPHLVQFSSLGRRRRYLGSPTLSPSPSTVYSCSTSTATHCATAPWVPGNTDSWSKTMLTGVKLWIGEDEMD